MYRDQFSKAVRVFLLTFVLLYCILIATLANNHRQSAIVSFNPRLTTSDDLLNILYKQTGLSSIGELAEVKYLTTAEAKLLADGDSFFKLCYRLENSFAGVWDISISR